MIDHEDPDYLLQQALEELAGNAYNPESPSNSSLTPTPTSQATQEPISKTIARWQTLFHLSESDAIDRIQAHRFDLSRPRVPDALWDAVREERETAGYDREAWEYELAVLQRTAGAIDGGGVGVGRVEVEEVVPRKGREMAYLVELGGLLGTADDVRRVGGLSEVPEMVMGRSVEEKRQVTLCCIDATGREKILKWASREGVGFEPTILVDPRSIRR